MSILNTASDGLFNVVIILVRMIIKFGPQPREDLLALCGTKFELIEETKAVASIIRWLELGLFVENNKKIAIAEYYKNILGNNPDLSEVRLPKVIRKIILSPENNANFWSSEENKSADFCRGIAWLLAQNVYTLDTSSHEAINELEASQILDETRRMFQNDVRWTGAKTWSVYLGFARNGTKIGTKMIIDPTLALAESLDEIFTTEIMTAGEFVTRAAEILPVLDGGIYRIQIEDVLRGSSWQKPPTKFVSTSMSRAIKRLLLEGLIAEVHRSDTGDGRSLLGVGQAKWDQEITHLRRLSQSGAK